MVAILDQFGQPIQRQLLNEPQTSRVASLHQEFASHPVRGLTPSKLAAILEAAERGDLMAQADLGEDMEEKDGHIHAELGKRKRALLTLPWEIVPPRNASTQEKKDAAYAQEVIRDLPDFEDLLFDLLDAIGKGYSGVENEWRREGSEWLIEVFHHRPAAWFTVDQATRTELRLRDYSVDGQPLWPFGWIVHAHKAKSGYLTRAGLHRVLCWPFLFKNYSVRDLAEFLEIYGLPLRLGTYHTGATPEEKATLLRAVVNIGHAAAGIIPEGMQIDFVEAAKGASDPYTAMMDWCERTQSKAILGQTLSAEAKATGMGSGVANLQGDVRRDILLADARQLAGTITRDLVYPLLALNRGVASLRRCPRFVFDTGEADDIKTYAEAIPKLVDVGMQVPEAWMHERLRIPAPKDDEAVLARTAAPVPSLAGLRVAALKAAPAQAPADLLAERVAEDAQPAVADWIGRIETLLAQAGSLEEFRDHLLRAFADLPEEAFARAMAKAMMAAEGAGRFDVAASAGLLPSS